MADNGQVWVPAFEGQRPPLDGAAGDGIATRFEDGNQVAAKHGAFSETKLAPLTEAIVDTVRPLVPTYRPADEPMLQMLAGVMARIQIANAWLNEHGLFRDGGELQPVLARISTWENTARQLMDRLGLSVLSRAQLELDVAATERMETISTLHARARLEQTVDAEPVEEVDASDDSEAA